MNFQCLHCGSPVVKEDGFCCSGCESAYTLIQSMGLGGYYEQRVLDAELQPLIPSDQRVEMGRFVQPQSDGSWLLHVLVRGLHCASCVRLIENVLMRQEGVRMARLNMSTQRMEIVWDGKRERADDYALLISRLGYHVTPFDAKTLETSERAETKHLLVCLAIAGFASGNMMLLSVALWTTTSEVMGQAMRDLMHWSAALIAIPTTFYAGQPFFSSAWRALKRGHTNMDVPIAVALILTNVTSLYETWRHGEYTYFDSVVMLLFFLLIGRYLDKRARGKARSAAQDLLSLMSGSATVMEEDRVRVIPASEVSTGMRLLVAVGEKIPADGRVCKGTSEIDTSLITGETLPRMVQVGEQVFAGTLNLTQALEIEVIGSQKDSLLGEIVALMEKAEQGQARYVRLADKVATYYTPVVHLLAFAAFVGWLWLVDAPWQQALMVCVTVLIITCPCALALAVPVVQVVASSRLMRQGILMKSGDALERLTPVDTVVFDKTGTLTTGELGLMDAHLYGEEVMQLAASLASHSRHPLSRACVRAYRGALLPLDVEEVAGKGLQAMWQGNCVRLGSHVWCGVSLADRDDYSAVEGFRPSMWLRVGEQEPVRFVFEDSPRHDMRQVIDDLVAMGMRVALLSGDRAHVVARVAELAGIQEHYGDMSPIDKAHWLEHAALQGARVLMVGDGLNDAPALATASVSMSPSTAIDISQNAADIVFQGQRLRPVLEVLYVAKQSTRLVKQNFVISFAYNVIAIPSAMMGHVTPLTAAIAMSSSSLVVIVNALRLRLSRK